MTQEARANGGDAPRFAVRYYTQTGNTKKLADAIAGMLGVPAKTLDVPVEHGTGTLFLGASVYAAQVGSNVKEFARSLAGSGVGEVVVFSTSALAQRAYPQLKKVFEGEGIRVADENFYCRGSFGPLHKGRPNAEDIEHAAQFAKGFLNKWARGKTRDERCRAGF